MARIVLPGVPYHVTHRGNERRAVFVNDRDRQPYLADLAVWANDAELLIWGYCLMSNHVNIELNPVRPGWWRGRRIGRGQAPRRTRPEEAISARPCSRPSARSAADGGIHLRSGCSWQSMAKPRRSGDCVRPLRPSSIALPRTPHLVLSITPRRRLF